MLSLTAFQNRYDIYTSDEWYSNCTEWLQNQHLDYCSSYIYNQWLNADLRDIGPATGRFKCLPILNDEASSERSICLDGTYNLQMLSIMNIGVSFYEQLCKHQGEKLNNNDISAATQCTQTPPSRRCLMLTLSDGITVCKAVEKMFCPDLHENLSPGVKLRIIGPLKYNFGVMVLFPSNVKVLGGEVSELLKENSQINVLSRALGKSEISDNHILNDDRQLVTNQSIRQPPLNQTPIRPVTQTNDFSDDDEDLITDLEIIMSQHDSISSNAAIDNNTNRRMYRGDNVIETMRESVENVDGVLQLNNQTYNNNVQQDAGHGDVANNPFNDSFDFDFTSLEAGSSEPVLKISSSSPPSSEANTTTRNNCVVTTKTSTSMHISSPQKPDLITCKTSTSDTLRLHNKSEINAILMPTKDVFSEQCKRPRPPSYEDDNNDARNKNSNYYSNNNDITPKDKRKRLTSDDKQIPIQRTIKDLGIYIESEPIEIQAEISTLVSKLRYNKGRRWSLTVKLDDGSDNIDIDMSNEIMESIIGFSSKKRMEYSKRKSEPDINKLVTQAYEKCEMELRQMKGSFTLQRNKNHNQFEIIFFDKLSS